MADSGDTDTDATSQSSTSIHDHIIKPDDSSLPLDNYPSGLPWIIHQILECQLSCELPLRIMFAYNSGQKLPTLSQAYHWWHYGAQGRMIIQFLSSQEKITPSLEDTSIEDLKNPSCGPKESINPDNDSRDRFMDQGNDLLFDIDFSAGSRSKSQIGSLPPSFVQKLCLNNIFMEQYEKADFSLALQGLDYIRNLEANRRNSLREAAQRLGITKDTWREVLYQDFDAKQWVMNMQALEVDIAAYYAAIFVDLRVWTMISELQCTTFYKPNLLAMLNTLFPPCVKELPNDRIDKSVLHKHRAHIFQYILAVEKHGSSVLEHFTENLLKEGTGHSWPETRKNLVLYFDRADHMIHASTAVHGIQFFRKRASKKNSGSSPLVNEDPENSNSLRSRTLTTSSTLRRPTRTFNSSKPAQSVHSRQSKSGIGTPIDSKTYFEPIEAPWASLYAGQSSISLTTPSMQNASGSFTQADANSIKTCNRPASRQTTPLVEQGSDAAQHDSFVTPITPFEDKRREVITRRETISSGSCPPFAFNHTFSNTLEMGSYFDHRPATGSRKMTMQWATSVKPSLPSDNLEFLKRPYVPEPHCQPLPSASSEKSLKKKSSIGSLFLRQKSSVASIATLRDGATIDSENALGIEMGPIESAKSTEAFPRFSQDPPSERPTLRKQQSFNNSLQKAETQILYSFRSRTASGFAGNPPAVRPTLRKQPSFNPLQKSETQGTMHSIRSRAASGFAGSGLSEIAEDEQLKRMLKSKASLPNIRSRRFHEKSEDGSGVDHVFIQTGDDYERYRHMAIPRPATSQGPKKKEVRKAKSFASIKSWATAGTTDSKTIRPRKSTVFRREPQEGERIRGKTISEPFSMALQSTPALLPPESRSKEYTRKWFIEEARAKRYGLSKPAGDPMKLEGEKVGKRLEMPFLTKNTKKDAREKGSKVFEMPRATPMVPTKPNRQKWDSIFERRPLPKKEKPKTYTPLNLSKYTKYGGK